MSPVSGRTKFFVIEKCTAPKLSLKLRFYFLGCPVSQGDQCPGSQRKVKEFEKERKFRENSGNFNKLSERKFFAIPYVQSADFSVHQNTISRSQGNFWEVREKSGKSQGRRMSKKVTTLSEQYHH